MIDTVYGHGALLRRRFAQLCENGRAAEGASTPPTALDLPLALTHKETQ